MNPAYRALSLHAQTFDDVQHMRIMVENRVRSFDQVKGLEHDALAEDVTDLKAMEERFRKSLRNAYRRTVPANIVAWQKATPGIGEHLLARLIGEIGHPAVAYPAHWEGTGKSRVLIEDAPYVRSLRQLWAYCGHGDPARKLKKGMTAEEAFMLGNPDAKMILHLLSEACMKVMASPYRAVYDAARLKYADGVHNAECKRCGPSGKPAQVGSPLNPGHQHANALRLVGKEILRDLYNLALEDLPESKSDPTATQEAALVAV